MSGGWSEFNQADQRLVVLRVLSESLGYKANDSVLQLALESIGHMLSRKVMRGVLHWLYDQGLIRVEILHPSAPATHDPREESAARAHVWVCELTQYGHDVANGRETHIGVRRPSPR